VNAIQTDTECPDWCAAEDQDHEAGRHASEWEGVAGAGDGVVDGQEVNVCAVQLADSPDLMAMLAVLDEDGTESIVRLDRRAARNVAALLLQAIGEE
jgi:hypothetical protein